ncbi:MAG: ankyrin repeat domain-containing protein [Gemmatimonadetes bacterium]|nr:ankyrin repeat domain-containing protein [Gemmatimonadota bacterium]NNF12325.1 ankyrin repeat domain-containing protein [Gemmatimonadota bacterium]
MAGDHAAAFEAVDRGDRDGLEGVLASEPSWASAMNDEGMPLLHAAAQTDHVAVVEVVLDAGADVARKAKWGHTALEWAANMNARRAAETLLDRGARLTLWSAAGLGRLEDVHSFLESGPDPEAISEAFYIACRNGALEVARLLREHGAEVDALGYFDAPAIHWAAINGHEEVAGWLAEEGADLSRRDPEFDATPAGWAREGGHEELARRLENLEEVQ